MAQRKPIAEATTNTPATRKSDTWAIERVKPYDKNAKKHPTKQVDLLAKLIRDHGFDQPIVVDKQGVIIKGHGRLLAAQQLGMKAVPVIVRDDLTQAQVRAARIADNKVAEMGSWDMDMLIDDVKDAMELESFDLEALGLNVSFINQHLRLAGEVQEPDTPDLLKVAVTKPGDTWYLGRHVLMCGDATKQKLKKPPHTIFTDPPYGVSWKTRSNRSEKFDLIKNDELRGDALIAFLKASVPEALFRFVCCNWRSYSAFEEAYGVPNNLIVWDKGSIGLGHNTFYRPQHEFVLFYGEGKRDSLSDVWALARDRNYKHPTQKPVALAHKALTDVEAKNVYDPFGGSGSTLLAAEQLNIPCITVELEPKYCDVIVERWETLTGEKAQRD
jgi:DNA modification methylase